MPINLKLRTCSGVKLSLLLLSLLPACNSAPGAYPYGPWGPSQAKLQPGSLYSKPWNIPVPVHAEESDLVFQNRPNPYGSPQEPLEPIGSWASRDVPARMPAEDTFALPMDYSNVASPDALDHDEEFASGEPNSSYKRSSLQAKSFTSLTGNWIAQEEEGSSCRLQLTSVPALDLFKASTSRCSSPPLQNVNSWSHRDGQIILYARGSVVARLMADGSSFQGSYGGRQLRISRSGQ